MSLERNGEGGSDSGGLWSSRGCKSRSSSGQGGLMGMSLSDTLDLSSSSRSRSRSLATSAAAGIATGGGIKDFASSVLDSSSESALKARKGGAMPPEPFSFSSRAMRVSKSSWLGLFYYNHQDW
ncbi:unnamed protein product [Callosobruchus maculatus]|uniref:Uncharacterized protein n=1 Tax=Callosobruchus maculatus TaxID=64391 RepID=A0A653DA61_CALMS|nr:unnamed protein product [Callosobruchus maculatus]